MFHDRHSCLLQEPRERGRSLYLSRGEGGAFAYRDHHPRLPTRQRSILPVEAKPGQLLRHSVQLSSTLGKAKAGRRATRLGPTRLLL